MKTLKCHCGRVRIGVPRRQKTCSVECAREMVLAQLAKNRAKRTAKANLRVEGLTPRQAWTNGYRAGYRQATTRRALTFGQKAATT